MIGKLNYFGYDRISIVNISDELGSSSYSVMQSDENSWVIDTFREAITSELMISLILKTSTRPYSCLAKVIIRSDLV